MNIFKRLIGQRTETLRAEGADMVSFSGQMEAVIGVSPKAGHEARDLAFDIPGFTISVRHGHVHGAWRHLWTALPCGGDGDSVGYSNVPDDIPARWNFRPSGTCTTFCPPQSVREKILSLLRGVRENEAECTPRETGQIATRKKQSKEL